jgi:hypothetical protein
MIPPPLVFAIALALTGIGAGMHQAIGVHDANVRALDARSFVAMQQMRGAAFRRATPILALATFASVIWALAVAWPEGRAVALLAFAAALIAADAVVVFARQAPQSRAMRAWPLDAIPAEWTRRRDDWEAAQRLRTPLASAAFVCVIIAALSETCR